MNQIRKGERGQTLVLFTLMLTGLLLFGMLVIDGGFFMVKRRQAQNVVDAAALAGAQELPDNPPAAADVARQYASLNGFDPNDLTITFECTESVATVCNPGANKYDTILVTARATSPTFFGPLLGIVGHGNSCWSKGCSTEVHAGACRGACGAGSSAVDAVLAIDHTGSMKEVELQNAKDGAKQLMTVFDASVHRIGVSVTPPVHSTSLCDTVEKWTDSDLTWLPVGLSSDYQGSPHMLNGNSALVKEMNCLDLAGNGDVPGPHTDLAGPVTAAMNELLANGRANATRGIVLLTDGAANVYGDPAAAAAMGARGPCDYAYKVATLAKSHGLEIYTIGYGVDENCTQEASNSPWRNKPASELLRQMATDDDHFYNQPKTADLDPVFQAIGSQLAGGSRLVK
ncbi:MAG TPA: pilus assembly protein TadG-related protein [Dehalococcoidia bacterium]|jgi:hypothetical protein|nr:pilus assembly protein TadG-related protein [Dehalococcoidia bacterium]